MIRHLSFLKDSYRLLRCLSFKKLFNLIRLGFSYRIRLFTVSLSHHGFPYALSVEMTTSCNLQCTECPSGLRKFTRPTGRINPEFFNQIIDQVKDYLVYLTLYFQGEPFLHPQFLHMVRYAHDNGIYTSTSTNGHFLTKENALEMISSGLDRVIISLDGLDQQTYATYRVSGDVEKVKNGIRNLVASKNENHSATPYIILQFIVFAHNQHQIEAVKAFGKEIGVDQVQIKSAQVYDFDKGSNLLIEENKHSRYARSGEGGWQIRSKLSDRCWRMWSACVITWDGMIVPCCFDKDADHRLGNLKDDSVRQIWMSKRYKQFREKVFTDRKQIKICRNCSEGL